MYNNTCIFKELKCKNIILKYNYFLFEKAKLITNL